MAKLIIKKLSESDDGVEYSAEILREKEKEESQQTVSKKVQKFNKEIRVILKGHLERGVSISEPTSLSSNSYKIIIKTPLLYQMYIERILKESGGRQLELKTQGKL